MRGRVNVVRVGQLTGDTRTGVWNMSEAWPLLLSTVKALRCLPGIAQKLDWLPLDVAGAAVVDIALGSGERECGVYHVVNRAPERDWGDLLRWVERVSAEEFEVVEPGVWLGRLAGLEEHPAKKLLWLWEQAFGGSAGGRGNLEVRFSVDRTTEASKAFRDFGGVNEVLLGKIWAWLEEELSCDR